MRWTLICSTALASWGVVDALIIRQKNTALHVGMQGWDNENFLDALGKGPEALDDERAKYESLSRFGYRPGSKADENDDELSGSTSGAILTDEMKQKVKQSHSEEEEATQGGKRFREMMEKAQQGGAPRMPPMPPPQMPPVNPAAMDPSSMSVEEQAALFRQMMAQQQQQPAAYPPPATYPPQQAYAAPQAKPQDDRRAGRNRDADAIVNTSDVYFAQLKRDSTIRNYARYSGDEDTANQVFGDPSIKQIEMHVNPYIQEMRQKEQEMIETAAEEMLDPSMFEPKEEKPKSYTGVSYKQKLMERRSGNKASAPVEPQQPAAIPPPPLVTPPPVRDDQVLRPVPPPALVTPPPSSVEDTDVVYDATPQPPPALSGTKAVSRGGDAVRSDIRTLMGLLIKHRGGPGFGAGRIVGTEMERFEELATKITAELKQEALMTPPKPGSGHDLEVGAVLHSMEELEAARPEMGGRIQSMVACIEGATQMYKNAPPELKDSAMATLRAALQSAIATCDELGASSAAVPPPAPPVAIPSQPTMAEMQAVAVNPPPMPEPAVVAPPPPAAAPSFSGNDANSDLLNAIYDKLQSAGGDGRMGLRPDLSADEAVDLADAISDLRAILVDELDSGIPATEAQAAAPSEGGATTSKYQEMLAKARAKKENN